MPGTDVSFTEENAWNEYRTDAALFFKRGAVLSADLPPGTGIDHARAILANISSRHEIFRTGYDASDGRPARRIYESFAHTIMEADAAVYPMMGSTSGVLTPNDLARVWLTPGPDGRKNLAIDFNEILTDSWSCARLQPELKLLADSCAGPAPDLPVPSATYAEFAREQRQTPLADRLRAYWRDQLADLGEFSYLAQDGPDPSGDIAGERVFIFTDEMTAAMRSLCSQYHLTPFMTALGLTTMVLAARSGVRDIPLGTMTGTRAAKWTDVQGNFSNVVLLRTVLPANPSFAEVLAAGRATVLGALRHQPMPYLQLSEVVGRPVAQPPVRVQFLPQRAHHYRILDARPSGDAWIEDAVFAGYPMDVGFAEDSHGRFAIWMSYDPHLFSHATAGDLLGWLCDALPMLAADQDLTCEDLRERLGSGRRAPQPSASR